MGGRWPETRGPDRLSYRRIKYNTVDYSLIQSVSMLIAIPLNMLNKGSPDVMKRNVGIIESAPDFLSYKDVTMSLSSMQENHAP